MNNSKATSAMIRADKVIAPDVIKQMKKSITVSVDFYNFTGKTVYVTGRDGICSNVNSVMHPDLGGYFLIRKQYAYDNKNHPVSSLTLDDDVEHTIINNALQQSMATMYHGRNLIVLDYLVHVKTFQAKGGNVYMADLDYSLSICTGAERASHPYSYPAVREELIQSDFHAQEQANVGFSIKIVDNSGLIESRYINVAGSVHRVNVCQSSRMKDGVYITRSSEVGDRTTTAQASVTTSTLLEHDPNFDNPKEPILYRTYEEARLDGDRNAIAERENRERAARQKELELDFGEKKLAFENEKLRLTQEIETMKQKHAMEMANIQKRLADADNVGKVIEHGYKLEGLRKKDSYEESSYRRKGGIDLLKAIPLAVSGFVGALAAYKKFVL